MKKIFVFIIMLFSIIACTATPAEQQIVEPVQSEQEDLAVIMQTSEPEIVQEEPTETFVPTSTPEPTATLEPTFTPTTTPLPEGVLFRDDFEGYLQPGWEWINENPEKWSLVEFGDAQWLQIIGDNAGGFSDDRTNILMRPLPEGDFVITAHVVADPRVNHHQANIFIFEDPQNYIVMNFGFCDHCGLESGSGHGYFMETIIENNPFGDVYAIPRSAEDTDVYLRLVNQDGSITGYFATEFGDWQRIGAFGNYFEFVSVGLGSTNSVPEEYEIENIEALFDYFEISLLE